MTYVLCSIAGVALVSVATVLDERRAWKRRTGRPTRAQRRAAIVRQATDA